MAQLVGTRNIDSIIRTSQQKAISTGLFTFLLVVVLTIGSLRPTLITIVETSRKLKEREAGYSKIATHNMNLTSLIQTRIEMKDKLKMLDYFYPNDGDFSLFITNLNQIAKRHNMRLEFVSFSGTLNSQVEKIEALTYSEMTPMTFQVSLTGDPAELNGLLSYLESSPFFPKVLSISYAPSKSDLKKTSISLTLLIYKMSIPAVVNE